MKRIFYKLLFSAILVSGIFIGMIKGQEARQKWVSRMKNKVETRQGTEKIAGIADQDQVILDEYEMATYHS
jgi:hypothetical protein